MATGGGDAIPSSIGCRACDNLQSFELYETVSNFYMVGTDERKTHWRVLKIDRSEPSELNISEDPTIFSYSERRDLLERINGGNLPTGGLKFVTKCYGIIGFVKFLGPYYMLLITERKKIGDICGHAVYAIAESKIITVPNATVRSNITFSNDEKRYMRLLCTVNLKKDFFFSYSYHVMHSFQKNYCDGKSGQIVYETMFVWNEYLTRGIRNHLKNSMWTVALVYGYFEQAKLSVSGKDFKLTLIARRSRHYAGTRYLKRGVNEKGRVANDVETEQIVSEDISNNIPVQITSVVQNRGSIPLFWSQETSWRNIKPDIILNAKDANFGATRLHFDNLVKRYGNPVIILNLIKEHEKRPRESILRAEFAKAIAYLNKDLPEENHLKFLHFDVRDRSKRKETDELAILGRVGSNALNLTGFFYCQLHPAVGLQSSLRPPKLMRDDDVCWPHNNESRAKNEFGILQRGFHEDNEGSSYISKRNSAETNTVTVDICLTKSPMVQHGVLRTNCIDCLDRTNIAQYAYGLVVLAHQLHSLGFIDSPKIDQDDPLVDQLMFFYGRMGDKLALQYGGSAAHNKIFSKRRGMWRAAIQSQEIFRSIQRYCSNTYLDAEKQNAMNIFLGYFQPKQGKPAIWELESDQCCNVGKDNHASSGEKLRSSIRRTQSDGAVILYESSTPSVDGCQSHARVSTPKDLNNLSDSSLETTSDGGPSNSRQYFIESRYSKHRFDESSHSNFFDLDWLSSENSLEEEAYDRFAAKSSSETVVDSLFAESNSTLSEKVMQEMPLLQSYDSAQNSANLQKVPVAFRHWVAHGLTLCH